MDKQKQIEEMAKVLEEAKENCKIMCYRRNCHDCDFYLYKMSCENVYQSEALYNAGYRKIPEGAVVLTMEEYEKLCDLAYFGNGEETIRKETVEKLQLLLNGTVPQGLIDEICKEISEGK